MRGLVMSSAIASMMVGTTMKTAMIPKNDPVSTRVRAEL